MIRNLLVSDLMKIESMHHNDFPLPEINDPSYIVQRALVSNEEVIGAAFARLTSELVLILDPKLSQFSKAKIWREVVGDMMRELLRQNIRSAHIFVTPESDQQYAKLLEDHLGFVRATGIPLYIEVK